MKKATTVTEIRDALGLSRKEFARKLGVDHVTVWRWEHDGPPTRGAAIAFLDVLAREAGFSGLYTL